MPETAAQPDGLLKWMGSLADASRLRLLRLLERHELGVSDLCVVVQMPQSTVSRHLKVLVDEGWICSRRQATTNRYRMLLDELEPAQRDLWLLSRQQTENWATLKQDQVRLSRRLEQRLKDSRDFFAEAAENWDKMRQELYGSSFEREALLGLLPSDWTVAELGCGTGAMTADLARSVDRVIAVDNSQPMLEAAAARTEAFDNVALRMGDIESPPIDPDSCDAALAVLVLTYVPDPVAALRQMHRIIKPGAEVVAGAGATAHAAAAVNGDGGENQNGSIKTNAHESANGKAPAAIGYHAQPSTKPTGGRAVIVDLLRHDRDDFRRQMGQQSLGFEIEQMTGMLDDVGFENISCRALPAEAQTNAPALLLATGQRAV